MENPPEKKRSHFRSALLGALVGGLIVAFVMVNALGFFTQKYQLVSLNGDSEGHRVIVNNETVVDSPIEAVAQVVPQAVVGVSSTVVQQSFFGPIQGEAIGSGFIVSPDGYIVTNQHVVGEANGKVKISTASKEVYEAEVVYLNNVLDLAVLKIDARNLPTLTLGNSDDIRVGQSVVAVGNPLSLQFERSVTAGIISALNRSLALDEQTIAEDLIQTDATINKGNSGGPLVNLKGEVIGINTYKTSQGEGMGFALPINIVKPIIASIQEKGSFTPTIIGIVGYDKQVAAYLVESHDFDEGIYVERVEPGSGADQAGLRKGDIILKIDDIKVDTMLKMKEILYTKGPGEKVKVTYLRNNRQQTTEVHLAEGQ